MYRIIFSVSIIIASFLPVFAQTSLLDFLDSYDTSFEEFREKTYISRFDMTKYLAAVRCTDCLIPDAQMISDYDALWLADTQKTIQYNIDDVDAYMPYNGDNYYYCLADTADA
jgi:hypothetical protein